MGGPSARDFIRHLAGLVEAGEPAVVATVVSTEGSASARPGAKALLDGQGNRVFGWVGGGCAETTVRDEALRALAEGKPRMIRLDLDDEVLGVGMPCGGFMDIYIEPLLPQAELLILGHGVIAETLAALGALLELRVTVNDPLATPDRFPAADELVTRDPEYAKVAPGPQTHVVITTQHRSDYEALSVVLRHDPAYVGMVASPKRSALVLERLREDGFGAESLRRVCAPSGLDIGADTPQEIALSIISEIVQRRRGRGTGRPLVEVKGVRIEQGAVEIPEGPLDSEKCPS